MKYAKKILKTKTKQKVHAFLLVLSPANGQG